MIIDKHESRRCSKCLLPEEYPNIRYDKNGVCNYCLNYTPINYKGEVEFKELLDAHRNKGDKYDCVVAVSGGRDSTFMLYELVDKYNMRVVAYNYDNGLANHLAKTNLQRMTDTLGVDLITVKRDQSKYFRNNLLALTKKFSPAMIPTLCVGCRYGITGEACKVAMKYRAPLVFFSSSKLENTSFKKEFLKTRFNRKIFGMLSEFLKNPYYFKPSNIPVTIQDYFHDNSHLHPLSPALKFLYGKVMIIEFFDYVKWDEKNIENTIKNKLNWEKPKNMKSSWRFDCLVHCIKDYFYLNSVGFTERDELLSNMIREGMITREEALQRLIDEYENQEETMEKIIKNIFEEIKIDTSILTKIGNLKGFKMRAKWGDKI